jgi:hypothetical protein
MKRSEQVCQSRERLRSLHDRFAPVAATATVMSTFRLNCGAVPRCLSPCRLFRIAEDAHRAFTDSRRT